MIGIIIIDNINTIELIIITTAGSIGEREDKKI